jgi:uncharacterized Fe-S cluster protein YjdI
VKRYEGTRIDVTFDPARCLHAAECVRGLPEVFDTRKRPWIQPDGAAPDVVAEVVRRCPTGALHYAAPGEAEEPVQPTTVDARPGGPLFLRGDLRLRTEAGEVSDVRAALCRCGATGNDPFCDASGPCKDWHHQDRTPAAEG